MAVAARTYAMHFGSRHAMEGFDFCDTTHCQDLRIAGIDAHLRSIAEATAGEVLWYDGEPAATYYHANCGGTTEDGRSILGNNEAPAPFLISIRISTVCATAARNGAARFQSASCSGRSPRMASWFPAPCVRYPFCIAPPAGASSFYASPAALPSRFRR